MLQTELHHDRPLLHVPATLTESHRLAPAAVGRSPRLQKKAFDPVEHSSVWKAFSEQGIEEPHTQLLSKLHGQQRATEHTDVESKQLHLERGTKQ